MHLLFASALAAAAAVPLSGVHALPYPFSAPPNDFTSLQIRNVDVVKQLGPQLSKNATIFTQNDPRFANATARWSAYKEPQISIVVEPGTEADVSTTVCHLLECCTCHKPLTRGRSNLQMLTVCRFLR